MHVSSAPTLGGRVDRLTWLWLAAGAVLLPFSTVHAPVALAAWLAPVFLLRFARTQRTRLGLPLVALVSGGALAFAWRDFFPFPIGCAIGLVYGLVFALPYVADRLLAQRLGRPTVGTLVFPAVVTTIDWLIAQHGFLATFASPAYSQVDNLPLLQLVSVTGIWGLTFLLHWFAPVANAVWEQAPRWRSVRVTVGAFGAVLTAVLLFGSLRLALFPPTGPTVQVAALGGSRERYRAVEPTFFTLTPGSRAERAAFHAQAAPMLDELFGRTEAQARSGAQVVSWFEDAAIILEEDEAPTIERARALARQHGIYLELGLLVVLERDQFPFERNRAILVDPAGEVVWTYDKTHPTPGPETAFTQPGPGVVPTAETPFGRLATVICFDMDYPSLVRQAGGTQADLLLAPSLDWDTAAAAHARMATVRAVENGVSLLRATGDGLSTAVDPQGRVLATTSSFGSTAPAFATALVTRRSSTLYALVGDSFAILCLLTVVILAALVLVRRPAPTVPVPSRPLAPQPES